MDILFAALLDIIKESSAATTAGSFLTAVAEGLAHHFPADVVVAFDLIPETGGRPRPPARCGGTLLDPARSRPILQTAATTGMVGDFIRHWQMVIEPEAAAWIHLGREEPETATYNQFLRLEKVTSFIFLPVEAQGNKLAALFLNFRRPLEPETVNEERLALCQLLLQARLATMRAPANIPAMQQKRMAVAHAMYNKVAVMFNGQLDALQQAVQAAVPAPVPTAVAGELEAVRQMVFAVMRELVIDAAGDLLVDLTTMSLAKALNTTAAALQRAWPQAQPVIIDIPLVAARIEQQPLPLREIVFTLVLELMGNAVKHGGPAPYIHVDLRLVEEALFIQVLDHGRGFDKLTHKTSPYGLGFWRMYVRDYLGGTFAVSSQVGYGTAVTVTIPVLT